MPGGNDSDYVGKLNGGGNQNIKNYVKNGGSYLGVCAGAYYGAAYVKFDKGGPYEHVGVRELAFFHGKAIGPTLAKGGYRSCSGSRAAKITLDLKQVKEATLYYHGGGHFKNAASYDHVSVIGYYQNNLPAIIHIPYGKGNVILSGVHFEYAPSSLNTRSLYLRKLLPDLIQSDAARKILMKEIFSKLGIAL